MEKTGTKKKGWIVAGGIAAGLILIYVGFSVYFMSHFFFGTTINGRKVSGCSVESVQKKIRDDVGEYLLVIAERDGTLQTISGESILLAPEFDDSLEALVEKQNGFAWIVKLFTGQTLQNETLVSYDEEKIKEIVEALPCMEEEKQTAPVDAGISEYDPEDGYTVVPSVAGTLIDEEALLAAVRTAVEGLSQELSLVDAGCYAEPEIGDEDERLLAAIAELNQYAEACITYEVGDDVFSLTAETFSDWLTVDDSFTVAIDEEQVAEYVSGLAGTYNTFYSAKTLETSYGQTVTISRAAYGWKVDNEAEQTQIMEEIRAGETVTRDLNYSYTANSHGEHDYGDSYVEINLTAQHLFLYKDGELVIESDFVSGDESNGNSTPTGAFGITYTQRDATLRGDTYETPVSYWMPFNGNVGMHDATWRSSFGAAIYKRNGSHGCINLPYSAAETIFQTVSAGYPVLVYELAGTESEKGRAQLAAYNVIDAINAIGTVSLASEALIVNARTQYDALSDLGKGYVTNYATLTAAEAALAALKAGGGG